VTKSRILDDVIHIEENLREKVDASCLSVQCDIKSANNICFHLKGFRHVCFCFSTVFFSRKVEKSKVETNGKFLTCF
jgi:hypothetical protein